MADLIKYSDSLRKGTDKLNDSIKDSNTAFLKANQAAVISEAAKILAESVQEQFNQVVIEGDSSVEAAQARVDSGGVPHPTLKSRLDNFEFSASQQLAEKADLSQIGEPTQGQVDQWLLENPSATTTVQDEAVTVPKLSSETVHFFDANEIQKSLKKDFNKLNVLGGEQVFYVSNATVSYIVEPQFKKVLRFTYETGAGSMIRPQKKISEPNPKWGAWFKDNDLVDLGEQELRMGIRLGVTQHSGTFLKVSDTNKIGFSTTNLSNGLKIKTTILAKDKGWTYIGGEVSTETPVVGEYTLLIQAGTKAVAGKLDIAELTLIQTKNKIMPYYDYPKNEEEIPETNEALSNRIKTLENELGEGEFTNVRGNIIGDSLAVPSEGYAMIIENYLNMTSRFNRHAIGGRPLANGTANGDGANTYGKVWTDGSTIDYTIYQLCLIAVGTNDFKLNVPIGTVKENLSGSYDTTSFAGALQDLIEYILIKNPEINIVLFTPLQRNTEGYTTTSTNTAGHKLIDYVDTMIKIAGLYGISVYDMYRNSSVNSFTLSTFTYDGLHLNGQTTNPGKGYKRVGIKMAKFIKNNISII